MTTNRTLVRRFVLGTGMLLAAFAVTSTVRAETINCSPISVAPVVISTPGSYCLTRSLHINMSTGRAIDIQSANVTLDMNGYYLDNTLAGTGQSTYGIYSAVGDNVTIRNGTLRGFYIGVHVADSFGVVYGTLVQDMRVQDSYFLGIRSNAQMSELRRNIVHTTGGTTLAGAGDIIGIEISDWGSIAHDNLIYNTFASGSDRAIGLYVYSSSPSVREVHNNVIAKVSNDISLVSIGIWTVGNNMIAKNNLVIGADQTLVHAEKYMGNLSEPGVYGSGTPVGHND